MSNRNTNIIPLNAQNDDELDDSSLTALDKKIAELQMQREQALIRSNVTIETDFYEIARKYLFELYYTTQDLNLMCFNKDATKAIRDALKFSHHKPAQLSLKKYNCSLYSEPLQDKIMIVGVLDNLVWLKEEENLNVSLRAVKQFYEAQKRVVDYLDEAINAMRGTVAVRTEEEEEEEEEEVSEPTA